MLASIRQFVGRFGFGKPDTSREVALLRAAYARIQASYDSARTSDEFKNYWANADRLDADSANSREVRHTLISRSRYEVANNAFSDGIAQTITNDLIGQGPTLRMQTSSAGFNKMVELQWHLWTQATNFQSKLWCMAHAKHVDGEGFGVLRRNPRINHAIKLDLVLHEAEQCQTPNLGFSEPGYIDGIRFDQFGNPIWYDFLKEHPGAVARTVFEPEPEHVPAQYVLHWFRMRRPGQHRGVPEMASSLSCGAAARRWRESTLSAAERAALLHLMMKTQMTPDEADAVAPFTSMELEKGLMNFLPMGWEMQQADAKFPSANHEQFHKTLINEMGRSVNMPRNKAAADSSDYNYASGRLDHGTYYDSLDVQRGECGAKVLSKAFNAWLDLAILRFGWLGGNPDAVGPGARFHTWDWPKHRVADVEAEANANKVKLQSGQVFLHTVYSDSGQDLEDEIEKAAESFGVTTDELRKRLLDVVLPAPVQGGGGSSASTEVKEEVEAALKQLQRRQGLIAKPNGAAHGN